MHGGCGKDALFSEELLDDSSCMCGCIVVMRNPAVADLLSNAVNPFVQPFKDGHIKFIVDCQCFRNKFSMDNTFPIERTISIALLDRIEFFVRCSENLIVLEDPHFIACHYALKKMKYSVPTHFLFF